MKNSFLILGFLISLLISCPPPTPVPGPDGDGTKKEFTVSFDANGGTGTIAPMKVKAGTVITLPEASGLSRQYFTFSGWTIFGTASYQPGDKYVINADTVFTANWQRNRVSITYRSNNNAIPDKEDETDAGSDLILPGNPFGSSPAGKHFYGWTTSDTATEANILAPGSAFPVEETALTFYAYWGTESVTEYKVTFSDTKMEPITFNEYIKEIRLPHYTGEPGMICKGWDTDSAAETVVYEDGGIIPKEKLTGNIVLYPILEDVQIKLTYIKNGAEAYPAYEYYMFPETAYYEETMQISEMPFYKNDGTDTPWILSGIRVTETDNPSVTLTVTPGNDERSGSYWEYTAGDKPLTVELLWEEQSISNPSFEVMGSGASSRENYLNVDCLTNIALSPGMITVTDETGKPVIPSQKMATCAQIKDGIRTYSCFLDFSTNIPDGTYNVIFTVSGKIIHTETVTVPEETQP